MTLEVLEEELRNVLYDLYLRGLLPLTDLMCSTQDNVDVDATVRSKCFHVHIADFLDCTIGE